MLILDRVTPSGKNREVNALFFPFICLLTSRDTFSIDRNVELILDSILVLSRVNKTPIFHKITDIIVIKASKIHGKFGFCKNSLGVISEEEEEAYTQHETGRGPGWRPFRFFGIPRGGARQSRALITGLVPRFIARARGSSCIHDTGNRGGGWGAHGNGTISHKTRHGP